jgi:mannosylglycerate hydrolase
MIEFDGQDVQLSAWKKAEDHSGWIVRLYSLGEIKTQCRIRTPLPVKEVFCTDLNEKPGEKLAGSGERGFSFELGPKEIKTLLLVADEKVLAANMTKK